MPEASKYLPKLLRKRNRKQWPFPLRMPKLLEGVRHVKLRVIFLTSSTGHWLCVVPMTARAVAE